MTDTTRDCPHCNVRMDYRLGVFECPQCGHEESAGEKQPTSGPGLIQKPIVGAGQSAAPGKAPAVAYQSRHSKRQGEAPPDFKSTWELGKEKMYLMMIFAGFSFLTIIIGLAAVHSTGAGGGAVFEIIFGELIDLAVLAAVLYIPLRCLKYVVGCYLTPVLIFGILGLIFSMVFIPLAGLALGGAGGGFLVGALGFVGILISIVDLGLKAWLASVLFRELY